MLKQLNNIFKDDKFGESNYIKNTKNIIEKIKGNLENNKIKYDTLDKKEKKEKLVERLEYINLNDKINNIETKFEEIKKIIKELKEIQKNLNDEIFKNSFKLEKDIINNILNSLETDNLDDIDKNINNNLEYINKIKNILKIKESQFFNIIYDSYKNENNEQEILDKTLEEFNSLNKLFEDDGFLDINHQTLKIYYLKL